MKPPCPTCHNTHNPENACRERYPFVTPYSYEFSPSPPVAEMRCGHCGRILDGSIQRCSNDGWCSKEGQPVSVAEQLRASLLVDALKAAEKALCDVATELDRH